ncbi:hypothetical protein BCV70DRAFT_211070 [Testicularia cyperi]|uniref:Proteasome assembly chaperone 3 n=1 Tax=Testicularia cyperi TaxID=1882483 RepID=A0A317XT29_9BASI|nr:hypothetical protein BCV70DRAFT_211070 [Testicularia cyperi]
MKPTIHRVSSTQTPVLPTATRTTEVLGVQTLAIVQSFTDRILINLTQLSRFGCMYQATTPSAPPSLSQPSWSTSHDDATTQNLPRPYPSTMISKLVGTEPTPSHAALYHLYLSQIAAIVRNNAPQDTRPLIISLALKPHPSASSSHTTGSNAEQDQEQDEEDLILNPQERERFLQCMLLVQSCRVW